MLGGACLADANLLRFMTHPDLQFAYLPDLDNLIAFVGQCYNLLEDWGSGLPGEYDFCTAIFVWLVLGMYGAVMCDLLCQFPVTPGWQGGQQAVRIHA